MRDIGQRIQRYRLTRFGPRNASLLRRLAWVWPILGLWGVYALFLGEHSVLRIWRLSQENRRMRAELASTQKELDGIEKRMSDPRAMQDEAEHAIRERSGFARRGERIYRYDEDRADSSSSGD